MANKLFLIQVQSSDAQVTPTTAGVGQVTGNTHR